MFTDGEKLHDLALQKLSALLRGMTANHNDGYYV